MKDHRRVLVHTALIRPPISDRNHDWQAVLCGYDLGDPIGHGPTEADAVMDLYMQIADREEAEEISSQAEPSRS